MEYHVTALSEAGSQQAAIRLMEEAELIGRGLERFDPAAPALQPNHHKGRFGAGRISAGETGMEPALKVGLLKVIAEDKPAVYSTLADALDDLSQEYAVAGELELVLQAVSDAVKIRRKLAETSLELHGPKLIQGLRALVPTFRALDRPYDASRIEDEISDLWSRLWQVGVDPGPVLEADSEISSSQTNVKGQGA